MTRESSPMTGSARGVLGSILVWAALGSGCGERRPEPVAAPGPAASTAPVAPPSAPPQADPVACGAEPAGLAALFHPGALIVFGELHGTAESPAFVASAACHAASRGQEVAVGLEIPR